VTLRYETDGPIAVFTLDRPKVNAITPAMHKAFYDRLQEFLADRSIHVGILTGAGERAFCGGDDIKKDWSYPSTGETLMAHFWPSDEKSAEHRPGWDREVLEADRFKPIIGAINGPAMGMGLMYLICHTDIRIATPNARLGFPEIKYGMGGAGGMTQLARHLPPAVAMWMLLTGEPLTAEAALKHDLINEIVEPERLMDRAMEIAQLIASHPPLAIRTEMELSKRAMDLPRRESAVLATHLYRLQRAAYLSQPGTTAAPLGASINE
jgi:enoyl-CoA hydratase/carnithine racemase